MEIQRVTVLRSFWGKLVVNNSQIMPIKTNFLTMNCLNNFQYFQLWIEIKNGRPAQGGERITVLWKNASLKWKNVS